MAETSRAAQDRAWKATNELVYEALARFGPMPSRWLEELLDETPQAMNRALSHLLIRQRVGLTRSPTCPVVQYQARSA